MNNQKEDNNNLKQQQKNPQNFQKIELYGSLTNKELKKKHPSRLVGGAETGSRGGEDAQQGGGWRTWKSHISKPINQEEQLGSKTDRSTQGSSTRK